MKLVLTAFLLLLVSMNVHAALHKWVDADGNVHYSDSSPGEDTKTQSVRSIAGKDQIDAPAGNTPKSYAEQEAEMRKAKKLKQDAAEKQSEKDVQAEARQHNCDSARQNVKTLEESPRVTTYDEKGERAYMEDDERAKRLEEARKAVSSNCN